jgi:hypothetical protein
MLLPFVTFLYSTQGEQVGEAGTGFEVNGYSEVTLLT